MLATGLRVRLLGQDWAVRVRRAKGKSKYTRPNREMDGQRVQTNEQNLRRQQLEEYVSTARAEQNWRSWNCQEFSLGHGVRWQVCKVTTTTVICTILFVEEGRPVFLRFGASTKCLACFSWCAFNMLMSYILIHSGRVVRWYPSSV